MDGLALEIPGTELGKVFTDFKLRGVDWKTTTLLFSFSVSGADLAVLQGGGRLDVWTAGFLKRKLASFCFSDSVLMTGLLALMTMISGPAGIEPQSHTRTGQSCSHQRRHGG